jgi:hypothetical protein
VADKKPSGSTKVFLGNVHVNGQRHNAGTKVSDVDLTDDEQKRFEDLDLIGPAKDLPDDDESNDSEE